MPRHNTPAKKAAVVDILRAGLCKSDQIAASIGHSTRTVYRLVNLLRKDGYRIDGEAGVGYLMRGEPAE